MRLRTLVRATLWIAGAIAVLFVGLSIVLLVFNIDCMRTATGPVRGVVSRFNKAVGARDWNGACHLLIGDARNHFVAAARSTHEQAPTCAAGLKLIATRGDLVAGPIKTLHVPIVWDEATATTSHDRYTLSSPNLDCNYRIDSLRSIRG